MKTKWFVIMIASSLVSVSSFAKDIAITVDGMVCSFCAQGITKSFKKLPEIKSVDVKLDDHFVYLKTQDGKDISDESINKIILDAGFNVQKIERK